MTRNLIERREELLQIAHDHGVLNIRLFGSQARDDSTSQSDIDLLVSLEPGRSLLDLVGVKQDLEELLGCAVDVVTEASLSPYLREQVLATALPL